MTPLLFPFVSETDLPSVSDSDSEVDSDAERVSEVPVLVLCWIVVLINACTSFPNVRVF